MRRGRILGPVVLITIGVLFALDNIWNVWDFSRSWPIILVVIGVVKLVERLTYDDQAYYGHPRPWGPASPASPPAPPQPPSPSAAPPPYSSASSVPGAMSYPDSHYTESHHTDSGENQNVS